MATSNKETIYIDVDDEITSIIEKVKASNSNIVALVLPKRATVLQSVVNMKLLKKSGTLTKKNIVLITSEKGLMPLAGVAGLHVAKSLQSKPVIPPSPIVPGEEAEQATILDNEPKIDKTASIGVLAAANIDDEGMETIELDNMAAEDVSSAVIAAKTKKLKRLKVPNFERFRLGFLLGGLGLILLIVGWYVATVIMPRAKVTITTNTTSAVSSFDFLASTTTELDIDNRKVPAIQKDSKKIDTEKVKATGQKDNGTKAEGEVILSIPCASVTGNQPTVPSGTAVSSGGLNFITQDSATLNEAAFSPCRFTKRVDVAASQNGEASNLASGKTFAVAGFSSITGSNAAVFSGGTSLIVKIVSQKDIDDAVATIRSRQDGLVGDELKAQLEADNLYALSETRKASESKTTAAPAVNEEAEETTVTIETIYTMLGINRDDLSQLVKKDVSGEQSLKGQAITDDGIDQSIMRINNQPSVSEAFISFRTSVTAGPEIDEIAIKENIKGKKRGEAESYIKNQPGVEDATIDYSPFWVYSTPRAVSKITITINKTSDQSADTNSNE